MRQPRHPVFGLQHAFLRRVGKGDLNVAVIAHRGAGRAGGGLLEQRPQRHVVAGARAGFPVGFNGVGSLEGVPCRSGQDGEAVADMRLDRHDLEHARHRQRRIGLHRAHLAAEMRVHAHGGVDHVGQRHVDAEDRRAGHLCVHVGALLRLAEQLPRLARAQRHVARRLQRGRLGRQLAIGGGAHARGVADRAVRRRQLVRRDVPAPGGSELQRLSRGGAGQPHLVECVDGRGRAAGDLQAEQLAGDARPGARRLGERRIVELREGKPVRQRGYIAIGGRCRPVLDRYLVEPKVEFLGHQRGQRRLDALPHLGAGRDDGDRAVAADPDIGIEGHLALGELVLERVGGRLAVGVVAEGDAAGDRRGADEQRPPRDRRGAPHQAPACMRAARLIAARMRG